MAKKDHPVYKALNVVFQKRKAIIPNLVIYRCDVNPIYWSCCLEYLDQSNGDCVAEYCKL